MNKLTNLLTLKNMSLNLNNKNKNVFVPGMSKSGVTKLVTACSTALVLTACGGGSSDSNSDDSSATTPKSIVAIADSAQTTANSQILAIDVTANDTGLTNAPITVSLESNPSNGTATLVDTMFTYMPNQDFVGTDSFTYKITDSSGASSVGTVTVSIISPGTNSQPIAVNDNVEVSEDSTQNIINVLSNDSGLQDTPVVTEIAGTANNGTVTRNADNTFNYVPNNGYSGTDSFTYKVTDANGDSDTATVSIFVIASLPPGTGPALEGYGTSSTFGGGSNSETCTVTNLNNSGAGSFRECVSNRNGSITNPVPRTIKFSVGGTITLTSDLAIRQPYLTIDGLDAPSPGITFTKTGSGRDGGVNINTWPTNNTCGHDVLVQGVRFQGVWTAQSEAHDQNAETFNIDGEDLKGCLKNVVVNRITVIDAQDAGGDIWGSAENITVQYSAFLNSLHPNTISHWPGGESGQERKKLSHHHNLYAYIHERGPQVRARVQDFNFEQNIMHKWAAFGFAGGYGTRIRCRNGVCPDRVNLIKNHWTSGGSRLGSALILGESAGADSDGSIIEPRVFMSGNYLPSQNVDGGTASSEFSRSNEARVTLVNDNQLVSNVLPHIGMPYRTQRENNMFSEVAAQITSDQSN